VTVGRTSQAAVEVLARGAPKARLGQHVTEIVLVSAPSIRIGQQAVEALQSVAQVGSAVRRQPVIAYCVTA
jgi:hypothetical protein